MDQKGSIVDKEFDRQRNRLEGHIKDAAEELLAHMGTAAFKLEIAPGLFVVVGTKEDIKKLLD